MDGGEAVEVIEERGEVLDCEFGVGEEDVLDYSLNGLGG